MKRKYLFPAIIFIYSFFAYAQEVSFKIDKETLGADLKDIILASKSITSYECLEYIKEISSDNYEGRGTGTEGFKKAAQYTADLFKEFGLYSPDGAENYFQKFNVDINEICDPGILSSFHYMSNPEGGNDTVRIDYKLMSEFLPSGISGSGDFRAKCVFAGYGISNSSINYNDFREIDIKDKVVIVLNGTPPIKDVDWRGQNSTNSKIGYCINNGAKGIIVLRNPLGIVRPMTFEKFPIIYANERVINNLLSGTGRNVNEIKGKISETSKPVSFDLKSEIYLKVKTKFKRQSSAMNVVGFLEGRDPDLKKEIIVMGAHLDHIGKWGDLVFHGANDNGSGSSLVMELAEAFATAKYRTRRSLLFILFTGEEMGLLGAFHYVNNPLFLLEKTVAMINMDVIGSGYDGIMVVGGQKHKNLQNLFKFYNSRFIHDVIKDRPMSQNSDHWPFASKNIPAVFLYYMGGKSPYHKPGDIPVHLNPDAMESAGRLVFFVVNDIANRKNVDLN